MADLQDHLFNARIGAVIAHLRKAREMTQEQLADAVSTQGLGFRQQTIVKIEKGQRPLRLREARAIASALGVGVDDLSGADGPEREAALEAMGALTASLEAVRNTKAGLRRAVWNHMQALSKGRQAYEAVMANKSIPATNREHLQSGLVGFLDSEPVDIVRAAAETYQDRLHEREEVDADG